MMFDFITPESSIFLFSLLIGVKERERESIDLRAQIYHSFFDCPTIQYMLHPSHVHLSTTNVTQRSNRRFLPDSKTL